MNVALTIRDCFDNYPCLFKERADVLNQLFCTIGNGYRWVNGELVANVPTGEEIKTLKSHLINKKAFQHNKLSLRAESQLYEDERIRQGWYDAYKKRYPDANFEELKAIRQKTINKLPDDVYYHQSERKHRWSFYCSIPGHECINYHRDMVYLFNYPDNIKPDWKAAIEETLMLLREDGYDV